jgi:hypothetical protein
MGRYEFGPFKWALIAAWLYCFGELYKACDARVNTPFVGGAAPGKGRMA